MNAAPAVGQLRHKLVRSALCTGVFFALLAAVYVAHVRWFPVEVVFYSALLDAAIALVAAALLCWRLRWLQAFGEFERIQLLASWALLGYVLAISVPTVIDRSLSFYILEKVQQHGGSLREDRFEELFTRGYATEHRLVAVRLTEQLASGTVTVADGCVRLTARGERLAAFSRAFRRHLLPRRRLLMGRYTDELTDPLRGSVASAQDACAPPAPPSVESAK